MGRNRYILARFENPQKLGARYRRLLRGLHDVTSEEKACYLQVYM